MAASPALSRRSFLAASAAGLAVLVAGCTSSSPAGDEKVTPAQADSLADQVTVQRTVVAAYAAAGAADPALKAAVAELAAQAQEQLDRLVVAAPGSSASASQSAAAAVSGDPKGWLREQVAGAGTSHAAACVAQTGARAALLGSIAAGLRGHEVRLA